MYEAENDPSMVIKVEAVWRDPKQFFTEVIMQREAATKSSKFIVNIENYEVGRYPREVTGEEEEGMGWFYIMVMKRYPMSLQD